MIFLVTFIGISFGVYTLNNKFANIFKFDFQDANVAAQMVADSLVVAHADSLNIASDSLNTTNELVVKDDLKKHKNSKITKNKLEEVEQKLALKESEIQLLKNKIEEKDNAKYQDWLKNTIKLYEAMESNIAAESIKKMPEEEARDIIYTMKKKKAAEVLSYLSIETVNRLTRAQQ